MICWICQSLQILGGSTSPCELSSVKSPTEIIDFQVSPCFFLVKDGSNDLQVLYMSELKPEEIYFFQELLNSELNFSNGDRIIQPLKKLN